MKKMNNYQRPDWNQYFMIMAKMIALRSTCNSRPGGAVIVSPDNRILATGYTASVAGSFQCSDKGPNYCFRREKNVRDSEKYNICPSIHAEQNAIIYAAKHGVPVNGSKMYCTLQPCYICLKLIAGAGITQVYFELFYESINGERDNDWKKAFDEYGIECNRIKLTRENIRLAINFVKSFTSSRRLKSG